MSDNRLANETTLLSCDLGQSHSVAIIGNGLSLQRHLACMACEARNRVEKFTSQRFRPIGLA